MFKKIPVTDFLAQRRRGVGGSDSAVVLGVNPYKDIRRLYFEKRGLFNAPFDTPAIQRGKALEPLIADIFARETGLTCAVEPQTLMDDSQEWFIGNIDRWILVNGQPAGVLEIKSLGIEAFRRLQAGGVDQHYIVQLQHYLELTGIDTGFFIAHNAEKWEQRIIDVKRDAELGGLIREEDRKFWQRVQLGDEPPLTPPIIQSVAPQVMIQTSAAWRQALRDYLDACQIMKDAERLKQDAKDRLISMMGAFGAAETPGVAKVQYRQMPGRKTIDIENLVADHPEIDITPYQSFGNATETFRVFPCKKGE